MKYTDEQLSRILSAAAVGGLEALGRYGPGLPCCINQAAYAIESALDAYWVHSDAAGWFDGVGRCFKNDPDALLRALEEKGWA